MRLLARNRSWISLTAAASAMVLTACGGGEPTRVVDEAPEIIVSGVEHGAVYPGAVTFSIGVDRGTFTATLNGEALVGSVHTVETYGEFELVVTARSGSATAERRVQFSIELEGPVGTVVRVIDLGANDAGGGGDAILVTDSAGGAAFNLLVDAGPAGVDGGDESFVLRRLRELGVDTLHAVVLSHAHSDHFAGMDEILTSIHVRRFVYNGQPRALSYYQQVIDLAEARADTVVVPDSVIRFGLAPGGVGTEVVILPPLPDYVDQHTHDGRELNEGSLGVLLRREGDASFRMFLTGDGQVEANARWRTEFGELLADIEVLKVGHHGANNAIFDDGFSGRSRWIELTDPELALISANGTTHARLNALDYLLSRPGLRTLCTNVHGELLLRIAASGAYEVVPTRAADASCEPGSEATTTLLPSGGAPH